MKNEKRKTYICSNHTHKCDGKVIVLQQQQQQQPEYIKSPPSDSLTHKLYLLLAFLFIIHFLNMHLPQIFLLAPALHLNLYTGFLLF